MVLSLSRNCVWCDENKTSVRVVHDGKGGGGLRGTLRSKRRSYFCLCLLACFTLCPNQTPFSIFKCFCRDFFLLWPDQRWQVTAISSENTVAWYSRSDFFFGCLTAWWSICSVCFAVVPRFMPGFRGKYKLSLFTDSTSHTLSSCFALSGCTTEVRVWATGASSHCSVAWFLGLSQSFTGCNKGHPWVSLWQWVAMV